jgi:4'-phosphopantetheinyl transferase
MDPWADPPPELPPLGDDLHAWRIALEPPPGVVDRLAALLSPDERARADRFRFEADRDHFLVARGSLRSILARYTGIDPGRLRFRLGEFGKPELGADDGGDRLRFNLSHSGTLALLVVAAGRRVGVDLERLRPMADAERIAARFFSAREQSELRALPEPERLAAFFRVWTRKEAYIKAIGTGLATPLDGFAVSLAPGEPPRLLDVAGRPEEAARWAMLDFRPGSDYLGAAAVEGGCRGLLCFDDRHVTRRQDGMDRGRMTEGR